jgi:hypothetical protein
MIKNDFSGTCAKGSEFVRENVTELDFELVHQGFELVEREVMFAPFKPVQRCVGKAGFLAELGIRKLSPCLSQVFCQLDIQVLSHPETLANIS